uniref:Centrosomal protein n=1 Tax=Rhabditophanes sp. KR3021 TaxID=114890 RepID=A0AC35TQ28_9BILA
MASPTERVVINFAELHDDFLDNEDVNEEKLSEWYGKLVNFELEESEPFENVNLIFHALQWIMQFEHTWVEELRENSDLLASEMGEKEENWQQIRDALKNELSEVREKMTNIAGIDDLSEAFRAEINTLKEENTSLKLTNRDRDRELFDERNKIENLEKRISNLEKDKTMKEHQISQYEETMKDLNRKISQKQDGSSKLEYETKKLQQRSEQAIKLSAQIEEIAAENEKLKKHAERLTLKLEDANKLINQSASKNISLMHRIEEGEKMIEELNEEKNVIKRQLKDKKKDIEELIYQDDTNGKELNNLLKKKELTIDKLKREFAHLQSENEILRSTNDSIGERKHYQEEMEKLRLELVEATNVAKNLFSNNADKPHEESDDSVHLRIRLIQMDKNLTTAQEEINQLAKEKKEADDHIYLKSKENVELYAKIEDLRTKVYGNGAEEVKRLEDQIQFREDQISKLIQKIILLENQLEDIATKGEENEGVDILEEEKVEDSSTATDYEIEQLPKVAEPAVVDIKPKHSPRQPNIRKPKHTSSHYYSQHDLSSWEASALLITNLNAELVILLAELQDKNAEIAKWKVSFEKQQQGIDKLEAKFIELHAKDRVDALGPNLIEAIQREANDQVADAKLEVEKKAIQITELSRVVDSFDTSKDEKIRRLAESSRRLIYVEIQNATLRRQNKIIEDKLADINISSKKAEDKLSTYHKDYEIKLMEKEYENEVNIIEMARLQHCLITSVPQFEYERVLKKYKDLVLNGVGISQDLLNVEEADAFGSINVMKVDGGSNMDKEHLVSEVKALQKYNQIITDQNSFWQKEVERLKMEVTEVNEFLDAFRLGSDIQNFIGALQKKFIDAINSQQEIYDDRSHLQKKLRRLLNDIRRQDKEYKNDRVKLVNVIMNLKQLLQRERSNSIDSITLHDVAIFHENKLLFDAKDKELNDSLIEVEQENQKLKMLTANLEAMDISIKTLSEGNSNVAFYQKMMQASNLNVITLNDKVKTLSYRLQKAEKEIHTKDEQILEIKKTNDELYLSVLKPVDISTTKINFKYYDQFLDKEENNNGKDEDENGEAKRRQQQLHDEDNDQESVESIILSNRSNDDRRPRTLFIDNSVEFEAQIHSLKKTTHIAIEGYKEQLKRKNSIIEEYKIMLKEIANQAKLDLIESNRNENSPPKLSPKAQFDEKNLAEVEAKLEAKEHEVHKLQREVKGIEEAYIELSKKYRDNVLRLEQSSFDLENIKIHKESTKNTYVQTDKMESSDKDSTQSSHKSTPSSHTSEHSSHKGDHDESTIRSKRKVSTSETSSDSVSSESSPITTPKSKIDSEKNALIDYPDNVSVRSDMVVLQQRAELRRLKTKLTNIERKSKELENENHILTDKLSKYTRRTTTDLSHNLDAENQTLKTEISKLKREGTILKTRTENLNKQVFDLEKAAKYNNKSAISTERWNEKKKFDETILILKKQTSMLREEQKELKEKIDKRDKIIEQFQEQRGSHRMEHAVTKATIKKENELKAENAKHTEIEAKFSTKIQLLESQIHTLKLKLSNLNSENLTLKRKNLNLATEKSGLVKEYDSIIENLNVQLRSKVHVYEDPPEDDVISELYEREPSEVIVFEDSGYETTYRKSDQCEHEKIFKREIHLLEEKCVELTAQITVLRQEHAKLQYQYDLLLEERSAPNSGSIALLKDKLEYKEILIETQRQKINELDNQLWLINNMKSPDPKRRVFY